MTIFKMQTQSSVESDTRFRIHRFYVIIFLFRVSLVCCEFLEAMIKEKFSQLHFGSEVNVEAGCSHHGDMSE